MIFRAQNCHFQIIEFDKLRARKNTFRLPFIKFAESKMQIHIARLAFRTRQNRLCAFVMIRQHAQVEVAIRGIPI